MLFYLLFNALRHVSTISFVHPQEARKLQYLVIGFLKVVGKLHLLDSLKMAYS
jgi:hypothetical protein